MIRHGVPFRPRRPAPRFGILALAAAVLLAGCATARPAQSVSTDTTVAVEQPPEPGWRGIIHPADQERLRNIDTAWAQALDEARSGGFTRRLSSEGALLDPDAALSRATLPPGSYRCRLLRFGPASRRQRALVTRGPFFCHVGAEGPLLSLTQQTGSRRPGGYLWDDGDERMIFIGAAGVGREEIPPAYGDDPERNVVGLVERIGPFRYRLVMPDPGGDATLEVLELIPALS